jgi:NADH-quinone oxidoreductase subunit L
MYGARPVPVVAPAGSALTRAARQDLYQDSVNEGVFMRPSQYLTRSLVYADSAAVDGAVMGIARGTSGLGGVVRRAQNGYVRSYAGMMLGGVVLALVVVLASRV